MKKRYFLRIPPHGPAVFASIPIADFRDLKNLAKLIGGGCQYVERVKADLPRVPWLWLDEDGFTNGQETNPRAFMLSGHRIVGAAMLDIGEFDLETPGGLQKWSEKLALWAGHIDLPREVA